MKAPALHFLLFSESNPHAAGSGLREQPQGQWRFVLQSLDGSKQLEAEDVEPDVHGERLELLAVVRGLEALPEPARVTLVTPSRYVTRGLSDHLAAWRASDWQWEHFGEMVPVKNRDLWQRIDRALQFHKVECRAWRFDLPHAGPAASQASVVPAAHFGRRAALRERAERAHASRPGVLLAFRRWVSQCAESCRLWVGQFGTRLVPLPWLE